MTQSNIIASVSISLFALQNVDKFSVSRSAMIPGNDFVTCSQPHNLLSVLSRGELYCDIVGRIYERRLASVFQVGD
jgi:hypothetical protein